MLRREGSSYIPRPHKKVINWGSSTCPWEGLNPAEVVSVIGNKLTAFQKLTEAVTGDTLVRMPRWTESRQEALEWLSENGDVTGFRCKKVAARTILCGHSGQGVVVCDRDNPEALPEAPLYVEYIPKDAEYRVHCFKKGTTVDVILVQKKVRDPDREPTDWLVRSHGNGFIYTRNASSGESHRDLVPEDVLEQARRALVVSGLDFGAVDVVWNSHRGRAYTLEINTACGLEGTTPEVYAASIKESLG